MASEIKQSNTQKLLIITQSTITRIKMLLNMGVRFQFSPLPQRQLKWYHTHKNKPARAESGQKDQDGGQLQLNDAIQHQL